MSSDNLHTPESGLPSPLFGEKFPYVLDGKLLILEIAREFAAEFVDAARRRANLEVRLPVTSAYPTSKSQCPRIAVVRNNMVPAIAGLGAEIETVRTAQGWRHITGEMCTDSIEVAICTVNEQMRDDIFLWFHQYMIDAIRWLLPHLRNINSFRTTSAQDDVVEYQGAVGQAGFQFYVARLTYEVKYDLIVAKSPDELAGFVNWQGLYIDGSVTLEPNG